MSYDGPRNPVIPTPDGEASIIIYNYVPSLAFGAVGVAVWAFLAIIHLFYTIRYKSTRVFQGLLTLGCAMEVVGYSFRIVSSDRPFLVNAFVVQYFMIVTSPCAFSAAIYLSLSIATSRINRVMGDNILPLKPKVLVSVFVTVDLLTTALQVAGAALIGTSQSARTRGESSSITPEQANDILLAGLVVQCFSFLCFLAILALTLRRWPREAGYWYPAVVVISSLLALTRIAFRLGETAEGTFGKAYSSEIFFACLEFLPIVLAILAWCSKPLAKMLMVDEDKRDSRSGSKEAI